MLLFGLYLLKFFIQSQIHLSISTSLTVGYFLIDFEYSILLDFGELLSNIELILKWKSAHNEARPRKDVKVWWKLDERQQKSNRGQLGLTKEISQLNNIKMLLNQAS